MSANLFGNRFCFLSFGESHGPSIGAVVDGCPAGVSFDFDFLQKELARRRPGQSGASAQLVSDRKEEDMPEILSGVFEGKTLGTPIAVLIRNKDQRSQDYEAQRTEFRAGHADDTWQMKFGHRDHRGGGRASGRETATRVIAGSIAQMMISQIYPQMRIRSFCHQIGPLKLSENEIIDFLQSKKSVDEYPARLPAKDSQKTMDLLIQAKEKGESWGGAATLLIENAPAGLGQPVFHKLKSDLAAAFMGIGGVCGVQSGEGLDNTQLPGTQFHSKGPQVYGGIRGGISTGEKIQFEIQMKPTSSILHVAKTGRHDPSLLPRAIPVFEAMTRLVLADHLLWQRTDQI